MIYQGNYASFYVIGLILIAALGQMHIQWGTKMWASLVFLSVTMNLYVIESKPELQVVQS